MNRLTAGSPAPAFELSDQNGTPVRLESFREKSISLLLSESHDSGVHNTSL